MGKNKIRWKDVVSLSHKLKLVYSQVHIQKFFGKLTHVSWLSHGYFPIDYNGKMNYNECFLHFVNPVPLHLVNLEV